VEKERISGGTMKAGLKQVLTSEYLALLFRLTVGFVFIYASMGKIAYPAQFAEAVAGYQMVPYFFLNLGALILPWVEFFCGLFLIIGLRTRAAAVVAALMLIMFIVMIVINIYMDAPITCGCFDSVGEDLGWRKVIEDVVLLGMAVHVYYYDRIFVFHGGGLLPKKLRRSVLPANS
jgi:putative oxidoreductase